MKIFQIVSYMLLVLLGTADAFLPASVAFTRSAVSASSSGLFMSKPISILVEVEVQPNRIDDFLQTMEVNAIHSRREPGCRQFDVLRAQDNPNKFFFYEVYETAADVEYHKKQSHYLAWADFKASGGTVTSVSKKAEGEFMTLGKR